ncbi:MAG: hemerythrin domain-containing protein [Nocardiopsaceae bacterium]|jgi:iron-sulfur cluster repair protein YtfE (RIC family)|nr:hemerythrin domain-containing protein [Nocardiopsaceae bacterium]
MSPTGGVVGIVSDMAAKRRRWIFAAIGGASLIAGAAILRTRRSSDADADAPSDVGFMLALHAALRRDISRMREAAAKIDDPANVPTTVLAGWDTFRAELDFHHHAEDEDLWPALRSELFDPHELAAIDIMVDEHRRIEPALASVDSALHGTGELHATVDALSTVILDHLAHEEREVLPLIEQHMTRGQWHSFLTTARNKRPRKEQPEFLAWVLDDAGDQETEAVFSVIPPPARLVYRWVLRPRHDAHHLWEMPTATASA